MTVKKLLLIFLSIVTITFAWPYTNSKNSLLYTSTMASVSLQDDECERLLKLAFLKELQESSNNYYRNYYTVNPTVEYFSSSIDRIYRERGLTYVDFTILPFLGPHETVGIDKVTFSIDTWGKIAMVKYTHTPGEAK